MNSSKGMLWLRWEKWRIGYNLVLLVEGLWLLWEHLAVALVDWHFMVVFAVTANVFYSLGPLIELWVWALWSSCTDQTRYRSVLAGLPYFLFLVGLGFSMLLVFSVVIQSSEYLNGTSDSPHPYF